MYNEIDQIERRFRLHYLFSYIQLKILINALIKTPKEIARGTVHPPRIARLGISLYKRIEKGGRSWYGHSFPRIPERERAARRRVLPDTTGAIHTRARSPLSSTCVTVPAPDRTACISV
jgi:hypothetical protein